MAHPYKQKYNNFNGPGHKSPANNIVGKYISKQILKPISRKLDDIWKATKSTFGPSRKWDNSVDWTRTKSDIGKMTIGGTIIGKGISGAEGERQRVINGIQRDNILEPQSIKIINDKMTIKPDVNLDSLIQEGLRKKYLKATNANK